MEQQEGGRFWVRMEEEEEEGWRSRKIKPGFVTSLEAQEGEASPKMHVAVADLLRTLGEERLRVVNDDKLSARQKKALLDENRKVLQSRLVGA